MPAVRKGRKARVNGRAQGGDDFGQRITKILIFAAAEAMPGHYDTAAKRFVLRIERGKLLAFLTREQAIQYSAPQRIKIVGNLLPRDLSNAFFHYGLHESKLAAALAARHSVFCSHIMKAR